MNGAARLRDRARTAEELRSAMKRLQDAERKLSISAVAKEAGVDPSLIHHSYKEIAAAIRAAAGKRARSGTADYVELSSLRNANRELRQDLHLLLSELAEAASLIMAMSAELQVLRANESRKVVRLKQEHLPDDNERPARSIRR